MNEIHDQGPFTNTQPGQPLMISRSSKVFQRSRAINKKQCNYMLTNKRDFPRLKIHEATTFHGLPVSWDSHLEPLDGLALEILHKRFTAMVNQAGVNATCLRLDWPAGTPTENIQRLMTRLQDQGRKRGTKIHFQIQAEFAPDQEANHWHGVIIYDRTKMNFPTQINTAWRKIGSGHKIVYRRNGNLPFIFAIGENPEEFKAAFRVASYLCKTNQPPKADPNKKARITSRLATDNPGCS